MKFYLLLLSLAFYQIVSAQFDQLEPLNPDEIDAWGILSSMGIDNGGWFLVMPDEFNNNQNIQDALKFGVGYAIGQGVDAGDLPDSNYDIVGIYDAKQKTDGANYKFEVQIVSSEGDIFRVQCQVSIANEPEKQMTVLTYRYGAEDEDWDIKDPAESTKFHFLPLEVYWSEDDGLGSEEGNEEGWNSEGENNEEWTFDDDLLFVL